MQIAHGLQVSGLYSHRIAVSNDSNAERSRAFAEALAAVVVKVSGEQRWLDHPAIVQALGDAQSYVEATSYDSARIVLNDEVEDGAVIGDRAGVVQGTVQTTPASREQRYLNVNFAASLIDELLSQANIPVWDSNRPSVLVWIVLQNAEGERSLLTPDAETQVVEIMQQFAQERGLPIIFPLLDFEDQRSLSEDTVWSLDQRAITDASERYGADSILTGRVHFTTDGELVGRWQFIFQDQAEEFAVVDNDLRSYLYKPLDRATKQLADFFALLPETSSQQIVQLRVEGIKNLSAYSALLTYVNNLGLVDSVITAGLDGERLDLRLGLLGDSQQLFDLIALDRDLLPIQSSLSTGRLPNIQSMLHYRWTR